MLEFGSQSKFITDSSSRLLTTARTGFSRTVKGAEAVPQQKALLAACKHELGKQ